MSNNNRGISQWQRDMHTAFVIARSSSRGMFRYRDLLREMWAISAQRTVCVGPFSQQWTSGRVRPDRLHVVTPPMSPWQAWDFAFAANLNSQLQDFTVAVRIAKHRLWVEMLFTEPATSTATLQASALLAKSGTELAEQLRG